MDVGELGGLLSRLIQTCREGERGFHAAAQAVRDAEVLALLASYRDERAVFVAELLAAARRFGNPEVGGLSAGAPLHRGWMHLPAAITGDDGAVLNAAEAGEAWALDRYQEALTLRLPPDLRALLERQAGQIRHSQSTIRLFATTQLEAPFTA